MRDDPHVHGPHHRFEPRQVLDEQLRDVGMAIGLPLRAVGTKYVVTVRANRQNLPRLDPAETEQSGLGELPLQLVILEMLVNFTAAILGPADDDAIETDLMQYLLRQN